MINSARADAEGELISVYLKEEEAENAAVGGTHIHKFRDETVGR